MDEEQIPYIDAHIHAIDFEKEEIEEFLHKHTILLAVSEDIETSKDTLALSEEYNNIIPCVGIHPWNATKTTERDIRELKDIISTMEQPCLGEVGLDKKFTPHTLEAQKKLFGNIIEIAEEEKALMNLHTAGTWRETFELINQRGVEKAIFHWYTGPLDLIEKIVEKGYMISVNAASLIQEKSVKVIEKTPLTAMLTESDGPYNYHGLRLTPLLLPKLVGLIAKVKAEDGERVRKIVYENLKSILR
jgi:TatD DNase family protein